MSINDLMWVVTIINVVAAIAVNYKKPWGQLVWVFTNLSWFGYNVYIKSYAQSALFLIFFCISVWGYLKWKKELKSKK